MNGKISAKYIREYLTTGQAAVLCSVTPDAVLKWVKAGKIPANRTPGGHFRIRRSDLKDMITPLEKVAEPDELLGRPFQYCWEFYARDEEIKAECQKCIVFRSRTKRCYEISRLPVEAGHAKLFCTEDCDECEYYQVVRGQRKNILFVTDNDLLQSTIEEAAGNLDYNIRFVDCEYNCSMLLEKYRADFVVLDCSMGKRRSKQFAQHVAVDPRIPFVKIIMVGNRHEFPKECDRDVFAHIEKPFSVEVLGELIGCLDGDTSLENREAV